MMAIKGSGDEKNFSEWGLLGFIFLFENTIYVFVVHEPR